MGWETYNSYRYLRFQMVSSCSMRARFRTKKPFQSPVNSLVTSKSIHLCHSSKPSCPFPIHDAISQGRTMRYISVRYHLLSYQCLFQHKHPRFETRPKTHRPSKETQVFGKIHHWTLEVDGQN